MQNYTFPALLIVPPGGSKGYFSDLIYTMLNFTFIKSRKTMHGLLEFEVLFGLDC